MKAFYRSSSECLFVFFAPNNNKFANKSDEFTLQGCVCEGGGLHDYEGKGGGRQKASCGGAMKKTLRQCSYTVTSDSDSENITGTGVGMSTTCR